MVALNIKDRVNYKMRHTFGYLMLSNGVSENWIAMKQMGHVDTMMLRRTYAKYCDDLKIADEKFDFLNDDEAI